MKYIVHFKTKIMNNNNKVTFNFFDELKVVKQRNKEFFENVTLGTLNDDEAAIASSKLWVDFIYRFHYPHEKVPDDFDTKNITNENTQILK